MTFEERANDYIGKLQGEVLQERILNVDLKSRILNIYEYVDLRRMAKKMRLTADQLVEKFMADEVSVDDLIQLNERTERLNLDQINARYEDVKRHATKHELTENEVIEGLMDGTLTLDEKKQPEPKPTPEPTPEPEPVKADGPELGYVNKLLEISENPDEIAILEEIKNRIS